jgi:hypothetical protein
MSPANATSASGAIPAEVLEQFDATRGAPGEWLPVRYSTAVLRLWWAQWLQVSAVGQKVAAELQQQAEREVDARLQQQVEEEQRLREETEERAEQERYRLEPGTAVVVSSPQSHVDGQEGRVLKMYWRGRELVADVVIDPLPPGHPEERVAVRCRRSGLMPFTVTVQATSLLQKGLSGG